MCLYNDLTRKYNLPVQNPDSVLYTIGSTRDNHPDPQEWQDRKGQELSAVHMSVCLGGEMLESGERYRTKDFKNPDKLPHA